MDGQRWGSCCAVTTDVYEVRVLSCIASLCLTVVRIVVHPTATSLSIDVSSVTKLVSVVTVRGGGNLLVGRAVL